MSTPLRVTHWDDGDVITLDAAGQIIDELSGRYEDVRDLVLRLATEETKFFKGLSRFGVRNDVSKEEF